ncbi:MAG TPA: site-specific integrase [Ruminococcus flavefaciens]|nr:site-specific integrase [Ruminococcus flavefaciens]
MKNGNNEGSIRKRSNGIWEGRYSDGRDDSGRQIQRSVYGKTRKEVAEKLNAILNSKQNCTYVTPQKLLLKDWHLQWLQNYASISIRPSTYVSYEGYIYNHFIPGIGDIPIQQLTPAMVQNFYNQKYENGRTDGKGGLSAKTIRNMHNMFHMAMEQARLNGIIMVNPSQGTVIPRQEKKEMRVLSVDEQKALMNVLHMHRLGFAILFDLATGLRIGELCALRWTDVNLNKGTIKVSRTLQRIMKTRAELEEIEADDSDALLTNLIEGAVKTPNGYREIPIPQNIWVKLLEHKKLQQQEYMKLGVPILPNGFVFSMPFGSCVEPHTMRDALNYLLAAAGIEYANFHSLRHTFATRAVENGVNIKTLSDILGHATVQITMDLYCHTSLDLMRETMDKISGSF